MEQENKHKRERLRYCIEYINPRFPLLSNNALNIRHVRIPDEESANIAVDLILSFGGKLISTYKGTLLRGRVSDWEPKYLDIDDKFSSEWLKEVTEGSKYDKVMSYVLKQYNSLKDGKGNTPEGNGYLVGMGDILRFTENFPTEDEHKQLKEDVNTLMELAFDGACTGEYEQNLLNRIKENLGKL